MRRAMRCVLAVLLTAALLSACAGTSLRQPMMYDITYCSADKEPVYIEKVKFDQYYVLAAGIVMGYWQRAQKSTALFPPPPVPKQVYIYWFNYRQQVFYEATVPLLENASEIMRNLPPPPYGGRGRPYLTTGVLPDGTAVVWVSNGDWAKDSTWIEVGRAKGRLAAGNPDNHRNTTEGMRQRGEI